MLLMSFLAAFIPMISYMVLLWYLDKYEKEPLLLVIYHFLWGAAGAIIFSVIGVAFLQAILVILNVNQAVTEFISTVIFAPFIEELTKAAFLIFTFRNKHFDNITDGLVYGGAVGLGFGMTENFMYFVGFGTTLELWIQLVVIRSIFSAVLHCIATATFGAFLTSAKFQSGWKKSSTIIIGLFLAVFVHFLWNLLVSNSYTSFIGFFMMVIIIASFFAVFKYSLKKEFEIIRNELNEEVQFGIIPQAHISLFKGNKFSSPVIGINAPEKEYIKNLVKLAFRKSQYKSCSAKQKAFLEEEIMRYRKLISENLS